MEVRDPSITPAHVRDVIRHVSDVHYNGNLSWNREPEWRGRAVAFTLRVDSSRGPGAHRSGSGRRTVAACWHAHRDVMAELFDRFPGAVLTSALARYVGRDGFEESHRATYHHEQGSMMEPSTYGRACECPVGHTSNRAPVDWQRVAAARAPEPPTTAPVSPHRWHPDVAGVDFVTGQRIEAVEDELSSWRAFVDSLPQRTTRGTR